MNVLGLGGQGVCQITAREREESRGVAGGVDNPFMEKNG